jgi:hypothetical protein
MHRREEWWEDAILRTYIAYVEVLFVLEPIHLLLEGDELSESEYRREKRQHEMRIGEGKVRCDTGDNLAF